MVDMILTVTLEDYPDVPSAVFPITIEYREYLEEIPTVVIPTVVIPEVVIPVVVVNPSNTTESGFEVPFFDPNFTLEPLIINGY